MEPTATPLPVEPEPTATVVQPSPEPTAIPPPTPTRVPGPAGYLLGDEHGIALVRTTRAPSPTRQGWVDITLDPLVITKFGPNPTVASQITVQATTGSICFANVAAPNDCLSVVWGSQEQFQAELRPHRQATSVSWPSRKAWPYPVTFEVPANATRAEADESNNEETAIHIYNLTN